MGDQNDAMQRAFLKHLYKSRCKLQEEEDTTKLIESCVRDFVAKTCNLVGEAKPVFKISQIIPSGSFFEGTKIGKTDEFDFMVILKALSGADKLQIHDGCNPWYKKLELKKGVHFGQRYMCNCHMNKETYGNYLGNPQILVGNFWNNISSVSKSNPLCIENSNGKLYSKVNEKQKLLFNYTRNAGVNRVWSSSFERCEYWRGPDDGHKTPLSRNHSLSVFFSFTIQRYASQPWLPHHHKILPH
ncbi:uncharacterized protein LOC134268086 [Saccostrea cucullata]|uniref:uncharacterized protein LOC134268086 n=1 Tax=Saccostrea cuccullata TaxID=36930 RepID=UPI002ED6A0BE